MSLKDTLKRKSLEADARERQKKPTMYRTAYHRFFEGYTEILETDEKGREHIKRIYTGKYYEPAVSPAVRAGIKALFIALSLAAAVLTVLAGVRDVPSNTVKYANIPLMASLALAFWSLVSTVTYAFTKRKMTIHDFKSSSRSVKRSTLCAAIALCASALVSLVFAVFGGERRGELICAGELLSAAALMLIINRIENAQKYNTLNNPKEDVWDNLIRVESITAAAELLEMTNEITVP